MVIKPLLSISYYSSLIQSAEKKQNKTKQNQKREIFKQLHNQTDENNSENNERRYLQLRSPWNFLIEHQLERTKDFIKIILRDQKKKHKIP